MPESPISDNVYLAALERVVVIAKIEVILNLQDKLVLDKARGKENPKQKMIFPKDKYFLPERWVNDMKQYGKSSDFTKDLSKRGINRIAKQTFYWLIGINILLALVIVGIALL